jgi:hypothetical protein
VRADKPLRRRDPLVPEDADTPKSDRPVWSPPTRTSNTWNGDFRHIKSGDLDLRPVFHRLEERVRAHVLICMLACYLSWHLRRAWAPLTFIGQNPPAPDNPVAPARRSAAAHAKASGQRGPAGQPYRGFRGPLGHLATLTRDQVRFTGTTTTIPMLARTDQHPTAGLRTHRRPDPPHLK